MHTMAKARNRIGVNSSIVEKLSASVRTGIHRDHPIDLGGCYDVSFRPVACSACWLTVYLSTSSQGLVDGGPAGLIWSYVWTLFGFGLVIASLAEMSSMAPYEFPKTSSSHINGLAERRVDSIIGCPSSRLPGSRSRLATS